MSKYSKEDLSEIAKDSLRALKQNNINAKMRLAMLANFLNMTQEQCLGMIEALVISDEDEDA